MEKRGQRVVKIPRCIRFNHCCDRSLFGNVTFNITSCYGLPGEILEVNGKRVRSGFTAWELVPCLHSIMSSGFEDVYFLEVC